MNKKFIYQLEKDTDEVTHHKIGIICLLKELVSTLFKLHVK